VSLEPLFVFLSGEPGGFLILLLQASFFAGWLILALFFLQRMKLRPASLFCALAALLRLLLPLPLQSPLSLHQLWMGEQKVATSVIEFSEGRSAVLSWTAEAAGPLPAFLLPLWAAGALWVLALFALRLFRQRRQLQLCIPLPASSPAAAAVREAARGRSIPVYTCENIPAPLVVGILHPRILIPSGTAFTDELRLALVHETAHIRRRHNLLKLLMLLACCLHWFNPLCWQLKKALGEELELSCDRRALQSLGENARAPYARALLHFYAREPSPVLSSAFGAGAAEERIRQIMTYRPRRGRTVFSLLLSLLLFSALASLPAVTFYSVTVTASEDFGQLQEDTFAFLAEGNASSDWEVEALQAADERVLYGTYTLPSSAEKQAAEEKPLKSFFLRSLPSSADIRADGAIQRADTAVEESAGLYLVEETAQAAG
jgi:beta-lactamase regulating signal transducer with metallopeptidase domain